MSRTRAELCVEVLDLLGVTQVGQPASAEDLEVVNSKIDSTFARLTRRRVVYLQDAQAIPDEYFDPVAVIIANNVGPKFGQGFDPTTDAQQEALLREMQLEPGANDVVHAQYF